MMNVINGGAHANNNLDLQEFMIIPVGAPTFREAVRYGAEVFHALKKIIHDKGMSTAVGDEGGFAPSVSSHEAAIQMILEAIDKAGYRPGEQVAIGLDCAASEFYRDGKYHLAGEGLALTATEWTDILEIWAANTPSSASRTACTKATGRLEDPGRPPGKKVQLVGDDLFVTNTKILERGIREGVANSILIKINQIGTLTETFAAIEMAKRAGWTNVISHRSGEPKTARSPISPSAPMPARSRPVHSAAATASPSTTSCCASRKTWVTSPATQGARRSTTCDRGHEAGPASRFMLPPQPGPADRTRSLTCAGRR